MKKTVMFLSLFLPHTALFAPKEGPKSKNLRPINISLKKNDKTHTISFYERGNGNLFQRYKVEVEKKRKKDKRTRKDVMQGLYNKFEKKQDMNALFALCAGYVLWKEEKGVEEVMIQAIDILTETKPTLPSDSPAKNLQLVDSFKIGDSISSAEETEDRYFFSPKYYPLK